jgi:hypothetical protein
MMSRWGIENDDGWFIVYKDGVEVASSENGDRMADVLNDAFHDANARIAELETENAALKAEISKLKAPQGWIDVKKQMPDVPIALVAWKDGSIKLDSTFTDGGRDYWYHSGLDNVAYWMPIPEPPEVKE